jgi:hypothetical protein
MESGIVWGHFEPGHPLMRDGYAQVSGGIEGFEKFFEEKFIGEYYLGDWFQILVCEKFKTRPLARSYKLNELEPIRIEGYLYQFDPVWQWPEQRSLTSDGVKASEDILKRKGLWLTGSDVGSKNADDVNAAQLHLLAYMRNIGHTPTIEAYLL